MNNSKGKSFSFTEDVRKSKETLSPKQVILSLCRERNWYLATLASKVGITRQSLNHYLNGRWGIPSQIKIKIAEAFEIDSSVIWDLEEKK